MDDDYSLEQARGDGQEERLPLPAAAAEALAFRLEVEGAPEP